MAEGPGMLCHRDQRADTQGHGSRNSLQEAPASMATPESWILSRCQGQLWAAGLWAVVEQGGFKTQLTFRPKLALHGQGVEAQLISPAALFPGTLSGSVRRCQRSEHPPRGTGPRCKGEDNC